MITNHLKNVCKIGQKEETCRYLYAGTGGFECVKLDPDFKNLQDQRVEKGISPALGQGTGDNCEGTNDMALLNDMDYINKKLNEDK